MQFFGIKKAATVNIGNLYDFVSFETVGQTGDFHFNFAHAMPVFPESNTIDHQKRKNTR